MFLQGVQERICIDLNDCKYDRIERQECITKAPVVVKESEICFKKYVEVYDLQDVLMSRVELTGGVFKELNLQMPIDGTKYCPYCFDLILPSTHLLNFL